MHRLFFGLVALGAGLVSTAVLATDDPILTRQKLMQANGAGFYGVAGKMLKGEIPFEATQPPTPCCGPPARSPTVSATIFPKAPRRAATPRPAR